MRRRTCLFLLSLFCALACRWPGRSEGAIRLQLGMTRKAMQAQSTVRLGRYGDSGRFVEVVLIGEPLRFRGCTQYAVSTDDHDRITGFSFMTANESWRDLLRSARETEELLLNNGWVLEPGSRGVSSLPAVAATASGRITESGAIDAFRYGKGTTVLTLTPSGRWGGIPWWRTRRAEVFWRSMDISLVDSSSQPGASFRPRP